MPNIPQLTTKIGHAVYGRVLFIWEVTLIPRKQQLCALRYDKIVLYFSLYSVTPNKKF